MITLSAFVGKMGILNIVQSDILMEALSIVVLHVDPDVGVTDVVFIYQEQSCMQHTTTTTTTTTTTPPPPPTCFPSTRLVNLENGKSVTMSELKIEDQVQTGRHLRRSNSIFS